MTEFSFLVNYIFKKTINKKSRAAVSAGSQRKAYLNPSIVTTHGQITDRSTRNRSNNNNNTADVIIK